MKLLLHKPIELQLGELKVELNHNKIVLPEGSNIRKDKNVDEIWMKFKSTGCIKGIPIILIFKTPDAKLLAESILKLCQ